MPLTKQVSDNNRNVRTEMIVTADNALGEVFSERIWPQNNYFKSQVIEYNIKKLIIQRTVYST